MTYRSYYTPPSDGIHVLNANQTAILILKNSKKISDSSGRGVYNQFKMLETQVASISGSIYSSTDRWALIEAMNDLGWQVAICRDYWTFIKTSMIATLPILDNQKIFDLVKIIRRTKIGREHGPLSENFKSFDITELSKFFYDEKELSEAIKATVEERLWENQSNNPGFDWDEQLEKVQDKINLIDVTSDDLNEYLRPDEFKIWEYLYYDLYKSKLILDVFMLKVEHT